MYNYIIGKKILEDGTEIKGVNEYVNLYNQQQKDKSKRLPFLVPLYKQILSDRDKLSWLAEEFDSDEKMLAAINESYNHLHDLLMGNENESLRSLLLHIKDFNLSQINITNDFSLTDISQHLFGRYDVFTSGKYGKMVDDSVDTIFIEGHTDSDRYSGLRGNWGLSTFRAIEFWENFKPENAGFFENYTNSRKQKMFSVSGYGETRAVVPNSDEINKSKNRRIDIKFIPRTDKESILGN